MRFALLFVAALSLPGADIYFAQASAGSNNGTSCGNAYSVTRFNTNDANWTAGNMLHLCGTWTAGAANTTMLTAQAAGSAGNPITIKFEAGAVLTSPAWSAAGAIACSGLAYITIDGGTNGVITNTANGQALANQLDSEGVAAAGCDHLIVKNLSITNLYIKVEDVNSAAGFSSTGINVSQSDNVLLTGNTITYAGIGIGAGPNASPMASFEAANNNLTFCNRCMVFGTATATATGLLLHDNDFGGGAYIWDEPDNAFHHNAIHVFNTTSGHINGLQIYNNYVHGEWGRDAGANHTTSMFFIETLGVTTGSTLIYNNLLVGFSTLSMPTNGFVFCKITGAVCSIYNNTLLGVNNGAHFGTAFGCNSPQSNTLDNNLIAYITAYDSVCTITSDYNIYRDVDAWAGYNSFAAWQAGTGNDAHGGTGDPLLDGTDHPTAGSSLIGAGTNLTSLAITALNSDKAAIARPAVSAWDVGVYQYQGGGSVTLGLTGGASVVH